MAGVTVGYDPTGSGAGIAALPMGGTDVGCLRLKDDERRAMWTALSLALDGIAIIVNKDSKVADLINGAAQGVFTGEITTEGCQRRRR